MIENYIAELLETNNRVIIPDFGAFMVKVEADKKTIMFNDFLKYNDGLLNNYIAAKESITKEEALKKIKEGIKKIQETLKSEQSVDFGKIGVLKKDERGGIQIAVKEDQLKKENTVKPVSEQKNETKSTIIPLKIDEPAKTTSANNVVNEPAKQQTTNNVAAGQKNNTVKPATTVKNGTPPLPPSNNKKNPEPRSGGVSTGLVITIAIIVLLGVAGTFAYLNYEKWFKTEEQPLVEETTIVAEPQPAKDTIAEEPQPVVEPAPTYPPGTKKYYIVGGSFLNEANAYKFVEQLKKEGYNSEIFMKRGDFWRVSYNSFYDRSEAFSELNKLKQEGKVVWIKQY